MVSLSDFILLDLCSQNEAVCRYVADWTPVEVLEWMSYFGHIEWRLDYLEFIHYPTVMNERSAFYFADNDHLHSFRIRPLVGGTEHRLLHFRRNEKTWLAWKAGSIRAERFGSVIDPGWDWNSLVP